MHKVETQADTQSHGCYLQGSGACRRRALHSANSVFSESCFMRMDAFLPATNTHHSVFFYPPVEDIELEGAITWLWRCRSQQLE